MVVDSSVVVAVISLAGAALVAVLGVVVAKILGTNKEEMERLEGVERRAFILEDYCRHLRDWGSEVRVCAVDVGLKIPPLPPWPPELKGK